MTYEKRGWETIGIETFFFADVDSEYDCTDGKCNDCIV